MTERKPNEMPMCKVDKCPFGTVANDLCLFHSRITPSLWGAVTQVLNSEGGQDIITRCRRNRDLWAQGIDVAKVTSLYERVDKDDPDSEKLPYNTHDRLFGILGRLKAEGLLPEAVDLNNREQTLKQVKCNSGYEIWLPNDSITRGVYFSLHWVCEAYENYLIRQVAEKAEKLKGDSK